MTIIGFREVLPRTFSHKFGESPTAERKFVVTTDAPEPHQTLLNTVGIFHGAVHPEFSYLLCTEGNVTETDRQHAEITYRYEVPAAGSAGFSPSPLARKDVWSFSTGGVAVPALTFYYDSGNANIRSLVNTAGDFFEGAMTEEAELRCSISGNRVTFPLEIAAAVTNCVNSDGFLGAAAHRWKCQGISGQQQVEVVNGMEITYWSVTAELAYRASGWNLLLPNVGWNYIEKYEAPLGEKKRVYVRDENGEKIPATTPLALDEDGMIKQENFSLFENEGMPFILNRRVHPEIAFTPYFGTPPF
jgi:hypothetical protein